MTLRWRRVNDHPRPLGRIRQHHHPLTAMNVQQLIEKLKEHPPEMRVIVDGYEGGYTELESLKPTQIRLNVHSKDDWWFGRHDDADYPPALVADKDDAIETALLLPR